MASRASLAKLVVSRVLKTETEPAFLMDQVNWFQCRIVLGKNDCCLGGLTYRTTCQLFLLVSSDFHFNFKCTSAVDLKCVSYRSDGVTLIGFDSFLQITLVVETLSF